MSEERCICCGEIIPEGRQVCYKCEKTELKRKNGFTIKQKLPSLNDYTKACRSNKYAGAKFKADIEETIGWDIKQALTAKTLHKTDGAVVLRFEWHERTNKRDADNIASAKKFILDALVKNGILKDDSRKYVKGFYDEIIDDTADFVRVELVEVKNERI